MNYLAHLYLSGNSEDLLLGNFIADSVKGAQLNSHSIAIQQGIMLHRQIDTFTDSHPIVNESKLRLRERYRKYAGVIIDIFYDHFLACQWNVYSEIPLKEYSQKIYTLISNQQHLLPERSKHFFRYMQSNDILNAYAEMKGVEKVLYGMSRRTTFVSNMELASQELEQYYDLFEKEFSTFFPDLQKHVQGLHSH